MDGKKLIKVLKYEEALSSFLSAENSNNDPKIYFNIGYCYFALRRYFDAIKFFNKIIREHNSNFNVLFKAQLHKAYSFYNLGYILQACDEYEKVVKLTDKLDTTHKFFEFRIEAKFFIGIILTKLFKAKLDYPQNFSDVTDMKNYIINHFKEIVPFTWSQYSHMSVNCIRKFIIYNATNIEELKTAIFFTDTTQTLTSLSSLRNDENSFFYHCYLPCDVFNIIEKEYVTYYVNKFDDFYRNPLIFVIEELDENNLEKEFVIELLKMGADPFLCNEYGENAYLNAMRWGECSRDTVKLFFNDDVDIRLCDRKKIFKINNISKKIEHLPINIQNSILEYVENNFDSGSDSE